jgi:CBS domain containing-hemolysin-like protein
LTLEDVLSELLGDVGDEFKAVEPVAEMLPDGRMRVPGWMPVDDAAALLETRWETEATTVGGFITAALGALPARGDRVTIGEYEFEVERIADRAIDSVLARRVALTTREADA